jgi:hypothetical protein
MHLLAAMGRSSATAAGPASDVIGSDGLCEKQNPVSYEHRSVSGPVICVCVRRFTARIFR